MQFYCPTEANSGTGLQKLDNFMTINGVWSREHHRGATLPGPLPDPGGGSKLPSRTFWVVYLLPQTQGGVQRRKGSLRGAVVTDPGDRPCIYSALPPQRPGTHPTAGS